jgi:hypothetical protein
MNLAELANAIRQIPAALHAQIQVRQVVSLSEIDRGPMEGSLVAVSAPVVGLCANTSAMLLFVGQEPEEQRLEPPMPGLPSGFRTGNKEYDQKHSREDDEEDAGDAWKQGG